MFSCATCRDMTVPWTTRGRFCVRKQCIGVHLRGKRERERKRVVRKTKRKAAALSTASESEGFHEFYIESISKEYIEGLPKSELRSSRQIFQKLNHLLHLHPFTYEHEKMMKKELHPRGVLTAPLED